MKKKKAKELGQMHNIKLIFQALQKIIRNIGGNFGIKIKINIMDPKIFIVYNC